MGKTELIITVIMATWLTLPGCESGNTPPDKSGQSINNIDDIWLIPSEEVFDGGPGKDGIPALTDPDKLQLNNSSNSYLRDNDLVLGYKSGDDIVAYPHTILDWHEIINDRVGTVDIAVTYCPLTGTGVGWSRILKNELTTFGISGLLYNSNLIPYDRLTGSNWSQIGLLCVNGELQGDFPQVLPMIEMPWKLWKKLYPESKVVSNSTGHSRSYGYYPYGDYREIEDLIFPAKPADDRLHGKERVLGLIGSGTARIYRFTSFGTSMEVISEYFEGEPVTIVGCWDNYMIAFKSRLDDGTVLTLKPAGEEGILTDQEGNQWNLFGESVCGTREGQKLIPANAFMGYWFSFAAFYPEPSIYQ